MGTLRMRDWLALASLFAAVAGFCLGTWDAVVQSHDLESFIGGEDPLSFRVMVYVALPSGVAAVVLGALALTLLGPASAAHPANPGATLARRVAWAGVALGSLVVALALVGAWFIFLQMAGPD